MTERKRVRGVVRIEGEIEAIGSWWSYIVIGCARGNGSGDGTGFTVTALLRRAGRRGRSQIDSFYIRRCSERVVVVVGFLIMIAIVIE